MRARRPVAAVLAIGGGALAARRYRRWHLCWGASVAEVSAPMPGDALVPEPGFVATRAITVDAPPHHVWPWIVQMGRGRAGFYSYDRLDNGGRPSADHVLAEFQHLHVGDLAAPMTTSASPATSFRVLAFEPDAFVVWHKPAYTWTWVLTALPDGRTRLVTRLRQRYDLRRPSGWLALVLLEVADFPMMREELGGLRERAERLAARSRPEVLDLRDPSDGRVGDAPRDARAAVAVPAGRIPRQ